MSAYDALPYGGSAVPLSHPDRLAAAAIRAGRSAADPSRARIVELGCGEGANLIPMAYHLPESELLGVDASAGEIEIGEEARARLGLDNVRFRQADILELDAKDLGQVDFLIVHGVFSWVSDAVRARILELARDALSPNGLLYLSYNCAAGWALKAEMRALLLHHTAGLDAMEEKVRVMRELLTLLSSSPLREASLHAAALGERAERALESRDAYLVHEYLSPDNRAFRHREVVELAGAHGLAFVDELASVTAHPSLEDTLARGLRSRFDDPVEVADVADTMLGRPFRASLFARAGAVAPEADPQRVAASLCFRGRLRPKATRFSLEPDVAETFVGAGDEQIVVRPSRLKAALVELARAYPLALPFDAVMERAGMLLELRRVRVDAHDQAEVAADLLELVRLEHLAASPRAPRVAFEVSPTPRVEALTRLEAERGPVVTSPHHELCVLDPFARLLVRYLDGARARDELVERMSVHLERGEVVAWDPEGSPPEGEARQAAVSELIAQRLTVLRDAGLLSDAG